MGQRPGRRTEAQVPQRVGFQTKPQLAQAMLKRALEAGVPAGWVTTDEVYGADAGLRGWLEDHDLAYVCWRSRRPSRYGRPARRAPPRSQHVRWSPACPPAPGSG